MKVGGPAIGMGFLNAVRMVRSQNDRGLVILTTKTAYRERLPGTFSKRKGTEESPGKPDTSFPGSSLSGVT